LSPKKIVDDLVGPKYIVDGCLLRFLPVEDENKKTARYYAIANINESHYSISGQTVVRVVGQVSYIKLG
jgi:hypothetical protein